MPVSVQGACTSDRFQGVSCYWVNTDKLTFSEASASCRAKDGDLVIIETAEEEEFIMEKLNLHKGYITFYLLLANRPGARDDTMPSVCQCACVSIFHVFTKSYVPRYNSVTSQILW